MGHAAGTKEQTCLLMVLAGPADLAAGLGVWVVGLGGLEPPTSSLSGMAGPQVSRYDAPLTSTFMPQDAPGCPSGMQALDARVTHAGGALAAFGDETAPPYDGLHQTLISQ